MMKEKNNLKIQSSALSIKPPLIEIVDNREMSIEGSRGIVEYNDDIIRVNLGKKLISIKGRGLTLQNLSKTNLSIKGYIICVEFLS